MNRRMWENPATVANMATLRQRGIRLLGPAEGEQACGESGPGRMLEAAELYRGLVAARSPGRLAGLRAVVTAGPTREAVDPVRYVGNRSSGKMGFAIADALVAQGASVTLVAGPVALETPRSVQRLDVESALQMRASVMDAIGDAGLFIACAAVADFRPVSPQPDKIKKENENLSIELVRNPDILAEVAALPERPFCVGFAAETNDLEHYAEGKRRAKRLDMIAANSVGAGKGFEKDDNALLVLWEGGRVELPRQPKARLAEQLVTLIADRLDA